MGLAILLMRNNAVLVAKVQCHLAGDASTIVSHLLIIFAKYSQSPFFSAKFFQNAKNKNVILSQIL